MVIAFKQLELDLWGDLKSALNEPEAADLQMLWQELDSAIAPLEKNQQLQVAAEAVEIEMDRDPKPFRPRNFTDPVQ